MEYRVVGQICLTCHSLRAERPADLDVLAELGLLRRWGAVRDAASLSAVGRARIVRGTLCRLRETASGIRRLCRLVILPRLSLTTLSLTTLAVSRLAISAAV